MFSKSVPRTTLDGFTPQRETAGASILAGCPFRHRQVHKDDFSTSYEEVLFIYGRVDRMHPGIEPGTLRFEGKCSTQSAPSADINK